MAGEPIRVQRSLRVFLLDDHDLARRGVRELLEDAGDITVVGEAATAAEALVAIPRALPDVAVLDARLPDGTGMEVCREVRSAHPEVRALILTSYDDHDALLSAIAAGASGYVLKQIRAHDLVDKVRRVGRGECLMDEHEAVQAWGELAARRRAADVRAGMTAQELKVFDLIGRGMTNREIAEDLVLSEKTVKNYVSRLLGKLGLSSRTKAAILASRPTSGSDA